MGPPAAALGCAAGAHDLASHKLRQGARLIAAIDEARPGALHNFMERRFLRPSARAASSARPRSRPRVVWSIDLHAPPAPRVVNGAGQARSEQQKHWLQARIVAGHPVGHAATPVLPTDR